MITIVLVGAVTALAMFAVLIKLFAGEPQEMQKMEKGDIIKQLLALSELENRTTKTASRPAPPNPAAPKAALPKPAAPKAAPPKPAVKAAEGKAAAKASGAGS